MQLADVLKTSVERPASRVDVMSNHTLQAQIARNKHILREIVRCIRYLAKQGLPFPGDKESIDSGGNPGIFLALMKLLAEKDSILSDQLYQPIAKMQHTCLQHHRMM